MRRQRDVRRRVRLTDDEPQSRAARRLDGSRRDHAGYVPVRDSGLGYALASGAGRM
jgi:hypothetical protein